MRLQIATLVVCLTGYAQTSLTLREALDAAASGNPAVRLAGLREAEATFRSEAVRAGYRPQVNVQVATGYQTNNLQGVGLVFPGFPARIGPYRTFNARPVLTQTIVDFSLLSSIAAANERTKGLRQETEVARESVQYAALQLYLQGLEAESRIRAAEARVRSAQALQAQVAERERGGSASRLDLRRADQQLADEKLAAETARRDRDTLHALLLRTMGREQMVVTLTEVPLPIDTPDYAVVLRRALESRAEMLALRSQLRVARLEYQAETRQRLPKVTAAADYGLLGAGLDRSIGTYNVGVAVTAPLWTGRRMEADIAAAGVRQRQIEARLRDQELEITQEVRRAQVESDSVRRAFESAAESVAAARDTLNLVTLRQTAGLATSLDVIVAQSGLAESEDREIRLRYELQLARARLAHAAGDIGSFLR